MPEGTFMPSQNEPTKKEIPREQKVSPQVKEVPPNEIVKQLEMPSKVRMAKIVLQVIGWLNLVFCLIIFLLTSIVYILDPKRAAVENIFIFLIIGIIGIISGIIILLTAHAITKKKPWARIIGYVIAFFSLFTPPIGTIAGVLIIWGLSGEEPSSYFKAD